MIRSPIAIYTGRSLTQSREPATRSGILIQLPSD